MSLNAGLALGFIFSAVDNASNVMRGVGAGFTKLDGTSKRAAQRVQGATGAVVAGMAAVAVGAKVMGVAFDSAMDAGQFEQDLQRVKLIMGASGEELERLRDRAVQAGMETQFSPQESLAGLKELGTLGFNTNQSIDALGGTLDFAAAANLSVAQASATTGSALRVFGLDADRAREAADKLMKISTLTALQANDLELALGGVSRGAGATKQSMDTMLVSMGLVKNTGVDASVAASSVSSALVFMAKNAKKFDAMGISITDAEGNFKDFNEIVLETDVVLSQITDAAERTAKAQELFGRFGLTAFTAISSQLGDGIENSEGKIVKGTEALDSLMGTMDNATGIAEQFKKATLDTLPGQITLIQGLWQTFKLQMGVVAADVLKPIATLIKEGMIKLIGWFKELSPTMRKVIGVGGLVGGALLVVGGAVIALVGALALALPALLAAAGAIGAALPAILPVVAAVAALTGVILLLREAYKKNLGGFADTVGPIFNKIRLFFTGLFQLITDGFLSGDTATQLKDPNNSGILHFLIILFKWGHRAKVFVEKLVESFTKAFDRMRVPFQELSKALDVARETLGDVVGDFDRFTPTMDKVGGAASVIANTITTLFIALVNIATVLISVWSGVASVLRETLSPIVDKIMMSFAGLRDNIAELMTDLGILGGEAAANADIWRIVGQVIGGVMTAVLVPMGLVIDSIVVAMRILTKVVTGVVHVFKVAFGEMGNIADGFAKYLDGDFTGAMESFGEVVENIWEGIRDAIGGIVAEIKAVLQDMMKFIANVIVAIPERFRPDFLTDAAVSLNPNLREGADVDLGVGELNAKEDAARQFATYTQTVPYANNIGGPDEKTSSTPSADIEKAIREALASSDTKGEKAVKVIVKVGEEDVAAAVERANSASNALSFGADSESDDG